jgi:hypothetical protein
MRVKTAARSIVVPLTHVGDELHWVGVLEGEDAGRSLRRNAFVSKFETRMTLALMMN